VVALIVSLILTFAMAAGVFVYGAKRPVGTPVTWGEALLAGTYIFALFFLMYGVVPHQWLTYADSELNWRKDAIIAGPGSTGFLKDLPFSVTKQTVRDLIVTVIYIAFLGAQIAGWSLWQNRGKAKPLAIETSTYGRPLVKAK
jgi:hypothetical protein